VNVRCTSCDQDVAGQLTIDARGLAFCCTSWSQQPGGAHAKATAVCPYSFKIKASAISRQTLQGSSSANQTWHVETADHVDYAFAATDQKALDPAYERLSAFAPSVTAERVQASRTAAQARASRPALKPGSCE
jgi:hypothetical protein